MGHVPLGACEGDDLVRPLLLDFVDAHHGLQRDVGALDARELGFEPLLRRIDEYASTSTKANSVPCPTFRAYSSYRLSWFRKSTL
jgi:hypothetical protein